MSETNRFYRPHYWGIVGDKNGVIAHSKSALNAVTIALAKELAGSGGKVNTADSGFTATDFSGHSGYRTVEQAASGIVWIAMLDEKGPTGGFYLNGAAVPW